MLSGSLLNQESHKANQYERGKPTIGLEINKSDSFTHNLWPDSSTIAALRCDARFTPMGYFSLSDMAGGGCSVSPQPSRQSTASSVYVRHLIPYI